MKIKTSTLSILLVASFLVFTGCTDDKTNTGITSSPISQTTATQVKLASEDVKGLKNLVLTMNKTSLNKEENTTIKVMAEYENNTSRDVTQKVVWIVTPTNAITITQNILTAKKDNPTTLKAKLGAILSNSINLDITWKINGYTLPPEPDKALNNATLLGIDSNDNGIRDDVERKIIIKYVKPIEIELMMSNAKVTQKILESPLSEAQELQKKFSKVGDCEMYLLNFGIDLADSVGDTENFTYNTRERAKKYIEYNKALSGGVYGGSPIDETAEACDFDVDQMLKNRK